MSVHVYTPLCLPSAFLGEKMEKPDDNGKDVVDAYVDEDDDDKKNRI
jgi:hypothetical protein